MRASIVLPALAILLAGCEGLTPPVRDEGYAFQHVSGFVFRWPAVRLPVRYWVAPGGGEAHAWVQAGIAAWRGQFLYGEFDGILVSDSASADVLVRVVPDDPPAGSPTEAPPVGTACRGITSFDVTEDFAALAGPLRVELEWDGRFDAEDIVNCLVRVAMHEVGHTLGIFAHSPEVGDLMAPVPLVRDPTASDRRTVETLYHTPPDLRPFSPEALRP